MSGPVFVQEPQNQVDFSNTTGAEIICQSRGTPLPRITWVKTDGTVIKDVPGLRQVSFSFQTIMCTSQCRNISMLCGNYGILHTVF